MEQSRSFYFTDDYGDNVQYHINNVTLIHMWKNTEEELSNPKLSEKFTPDTTKIPAELFLYYERINEWTETVS